jgi:hypothetical protein
MPMVGSGPVFAGINGGPLHPSVLVFAPIGWALVLGFLNDGELSADSSTSNKHAA